MSAASPGTVRIAAVAAHFGRDLPRSVAKVGGILADARARGVRLLVLPHATLGGYLSDLRHPDRDALPPALDEDSPEVRALVVLAFPEAARSLARDGATVLACLSAWPASVTDRASRLPQDRQSRLFDLYDQARAAENQVVWVSSNQTGVTGRLRFLGQAKVVGPGGDILARTSSKGGLAVADVDVEAEVARSRRVLHHLNELVPQAYSAEVWRS